MKKLLATLLALTPVPALADWQFTRWGMTPEEVVSASGGSAYLTPPKASGSELLAATGTYAAGDLDFQTSFLFLDGRLNSVVLRYNNWAPSQGGRLRKNGQNCDDVRKALIAAYGTPDVSQLGDALWSNRDTARQITFKNTGDAMICTVRYQHGADVDHLDRTRGAKM